VKRMKVTLRRRGQALVETALTVTILVLLSLGIVQFGYAFMELEMITNAARDGARFGAARVNRDDCDCLQAGDLTTNTGTIAALVKTEIGNVMDASLLSVTVVQTPLPCAGGCPCDPASCATIPATALRTVDVTVSGTVPYMFRLIGTGYGVNRVVRFRDEQAGS
jgi:Flp pilus assembly protein TadG